MGKGIGEPRPEGHETRILQDDHGLAVSRITIFPLIGLRCRPQSRRMRLARLVASRTSEPSQCVSEDSVEFCGRAKAAASS